MADTSENGVRVDRAKTFLLIACLHGCPTLSDGLRFSHPFVLSHGTASAAIACPPTAKLYAWLLVLPISFQMFAIAARHAHMHAFAQIVPCTYVWLWHLRGENSSTSKSKPIQIKAHRIEWKLYRANEFIDWPPWFARKSNRLQQWQSKRMEKEKKNKQTNERQIYYLAHALWCAVRRGLCAVTYTFYLIGHFTCSDKHSMRSQ